MAPGNKPERQGLRRRNLFVGIAMATGAITALAVTLALTCGERIFSPSPAGRVDRGPSMSTSGGHDADMSRRLYRLSGTFSTALPCAGPCDVTFTVYEKEKYAAGRATATYDGATLRNVVCDAVACITGVEIVNGEARVHFTADGYKKDGRFGSNTRFEVAVAGAGTSVLDLHTSCSQGPIRIGHPYPASPAGEVLFTDGTGCVCFGADCGATAGGECPDSRKLYRADGEFHTDMAVTLPAEITFKLYKKDKYVKGLATARYDGSRLVDVTCDDFACITGAEMADGKLIVVFSTNGYEKYGKFGADSRFVVEVTGVGETRLDLHTSCSQGPIELMRPYPASPSGRVIFTDGCGCIGEATSEQEPDCPDTRKLYRAEGEFHTGLAASLPASVTFTLYHKDKDLVGQSTATYDGFRLSGVSCDGVACITGMEVLGGKLVVAFTTNGYDKYGRFGANSRFAVQVDGVGDAYLDLHTSCSQGPLRLFDPYPAQPGGEVIFTDGCGCVTGTPDEEPEEEPDTYPDAE